MCDSQNLNNNPLCDLNNPTGIVAWTEKAKKEYGETKNMPQFIKNLKSPMRRINMTNGLLKSEYKESNYTRTYNAFKEDIAILNIFFGKSTAMSNQSLKDN